VRAPGGQEAREEGGTDSRIRIEPAAARPGQEVSVHLDGADADQVELGYLAADADVAAAFGDDELGAWVGVDTAAAVAGEPVALRVPADAPPSSGSIARWLVRAGDESADLRVLAVRPAVIGELAHETEGRNGFRLEIELPDPAARIGDVLRGRVVLDGDTGGAFKEVSIGLYRDTGTDRSCRQSSALARDMVLRFGHPRLIDFELSVPDDCEPTATAPHGAIRWWVQAWAWRGWDRPDGPKVRREIILFNSD
jgi:hypothetical protein